MRPYTIRSLIFNELDTHFQKGSKTFPDYVDILKIVRKNFPTSKFNNSAWNTYQSQYLKLTKRKVA